MQKAGSGTGRRRCVDAVVSNPPYSQQWDSRDRENDARFKDYGVAPKSKADYAFLLHELHHLKPDGILTIVLPHGVLFRGGEEEQIRTNLIEKNHIDAIIGLPANIFFGTGIPTLIMVLKQHRDNDDVLIIDASKGFVKEGKQNRLRACDIKKIADTVRDRKDIAGFSKKVSREEIRANGYNLNIPRYVDSSEAAEQYDIYATMFGGIPNTEIDAMRKYWDAFPSLRGDLFTPYSDKPYAALKVEDVKTTIEQNTDVKRFTMQFAEAFRGFADRLHHVLIDNVKNVHELQAQDEIATDIFLRLAAIPLVDNYAAYQALADQWQAIISDIETIQDEGMEAVRTVETAYKLVKKNDEDIEVPDGLKGRIIPFELVQRVKSQAELDAMAAVQARVEAIGGELEEVRDGFGEEEMETYCDSEKDNAPDKKKITADAKPKADVEPDTKAKLKQMVALWDEQTKLNKTIKADKLALEEKTIQAIEQLTDEEIADFLHRKWIVPVCQGINGSLTAVLSALETAALALSRKYAVSYQQIDDEIAQANAELSHLVSQLTGDDFAIKGLEALIKQQ